MREQRFVCLSIFAHSARDSGRGGDRLDISQDDIVANGWALEVRINSEDPFRGFLPSNGRISRYATPADSGGVRIDTGVVARSEVLLHYKPMIAKLCTSGEDRASVLAVMRDALDCKLQGELACCTKVTWPPVSG